MPCKCLPTLAVFFQLFADLAMGSKRSFNPSFLRENVDCKNIKQLQGYFPGHFEILRRFPDFTMSLEWLLGFSALR